MKRERAARKKLRGPDSEEEVFAMNRHAGFAIAMLAFFGAIAMAFIYG